MIWRGGGSSTYFNKITKWLRNSAVVVLKQNKIKQLIHMQYYEYRNQKIISTSRDIPCSYK